MKERRQSFSERETAPAHWSCWSNGKIGLLSGWARVNPTWIPHLALPSFGKSGRTQGAGCKAVQGHCQDRPGGGSIFLSQVRGHVEEGGNKVAGRGSWFTFRRPSERGWRMVWRELLGAKVRGASKVPNHCATHLGLGGGGG